MIGLLQRVTHASVTVDGVVVGRIGPGLLVLVAVEPADSQAQADRLVERLIGYRVFEMPRGRMNQSLLDTGGGLLLVRSSRWRPTRARACGRASPAQLLRNSGGAVRLHGAPGALAAWGSGCDGPLRRAHAGEPDE